MADLVKYLGNTEFKRIHELLDPLNIKIKQYKDLYMLYFSEDADFNNKIVRQATGMILEKDTNKVIHYSFEKTYEGFTGRFNLCSTDAFPLENLKNFTVEPYFEGSIVKLFYYKGQWNIATSKSINASNNTWTSKKSFKILFEECVKYSYNCYYEEFENTLDKDFFHTFLIQHPENKLVSNVGTPCLFYINKVNKETLKETRMEKGLFELDINEFKQKLEVGNIDINYIIYIENEDKSTTTRVKLLTGDFYNKFFLRGNHPEILIEYLKRVYDNPEIKQEYRKLFPEEFQRFEYMDSVVNNAIVDIYNLYRERYVIKKQSPDIPKRYEMTIKQLHGQYKRTRVAITMADVYYKLYSLEPRIQMYILNI